MKELVLRAVQLELHAMPKRSREGRRRLSSRKNPGSLLLDNDKIFEVIPLPGSQCLDRPDVYPARPLRLRSALVYISPGRCWLGFCRFTQLALLRPLTTPAVRGNEVLSQARAWNFYDDWLQEGGAW